MWCVNLGGGSVGMGTHDFNVDSMDNHSFGDRAFGVRDVHPTHPHPTAARPCWMLRAWCCDAWLRGAGVCVCWVARCREMARNGGRCATMRVDAGVGATVGVSRTCIRREAAGAKGTGTG